MTHPIETKYLYQIRKSQRITKPVCRVFWGVRRPLRDTAILNMARPTLHLPTNNITCCILSSCLFFKHLRVNWCIRNWCRSVLGQWFWLLSSNITKQLIRNLQYFFPFNLLIQDIKFFVPISFISTSFGHYQHQEFSSSLLMNECAPNSLLALCASNWGTWFLCPLLYILLRLCKSEQYLFVWHFHTYIRKLIAPRWTVHGLTLNQNFWVSLMLPLWKKICCHEGQFPALLYQHIGGDPTVSKITP